MNITFKNKAGTLQAEVKRSGSSYHASEQRVFAGRIEHIKDHTFEHMRALKRWLVRKGLTDKAVQK